MIARILIALAVVTVLGVDDFESEGQMDKPTNLDPEAWARYNESQARTLAELSRPHPPNLDGTRCECSRCETCQRRHAEARAVVNDALAAALREEDGP